MSEKRHELKVGIFVFIGLVLIGALMLYFSKAQSLFKPTYTIFLETRFVGGLKPQAKVLLSGIEIGSVEEIHLAKDERTAVVKMKLLKQYNIHKDAEFKVAALGLLGDQFISVQPMANKLEVLKDGDVVTGQGPLQLEDVIVTVKELAPTARDAIEQIRTLGVQLNESMKRVDQMVLNQQTLTNLSLAVSNFLVVSERAIVAVDDISLLFKTNTPPLNATMTNLSKFSERLDDLADELNQTIVTNRTILTRAMKNVEDVSIDAKGLVQDVRSGKGVAGSLIEDEQLKLEMAQILTNLNAATANLTILSSNINTKGLWRVLWKPKSEPAKKK